MEELATEIAIVGGGPAGIAAAIEAARLGAHATIIDEKAKVGGQIYRQFPNGFNINEDKLEKNYLDKDYLEGQRLIAEIQDISGRVSVLTNCLVWGVFPDKKVAFVQSGRNMTLGCEKLILAEGAHERPMPFPGWTLPGVITAGGAQALMKTQRVLPGESILLSGCGPLQLVLANQLIESGAKVEAVLEASSMRTIRQLPSLFLELGLFKDGLRYLNNLRKARVPFLTKHAILEARGKKEVSSARYAKLDRNCRPIPGSEKDVEIDTICLGYGFISSSRLSQLCGCEHYYDKVTQCWVPKHSTGMESTVPGIFVAGDCAGVAGHLVAIEEGRIAGIKAAEQLRRTDSKKTEKSAKDALRRLKKLGKFELALNKMFRVPLGLYSRLTDDTIICRCEDVTAGEIRSAIAGSPKLDVNEVKKMTRAGMGDCQGRMCMSTVAAMISIETGKPIESSGYITYRAPVKPIPIGAFLKRSENVSERSADATFDQNFRELEGAHQ